MGRSTLNIAVILFMFLTGTGGVTAQVIVNPFDEAPTDTSYWMWFEPVNGDRSTGAHFTTNWNADSVLSWIDIAYVDQPAMYGSGALRLEWSVHNNEVYGGYSRIEHWHPDPEQVYDWSEYDSLSFWYHVVSPASLPARVQFRFNLHEVSHSPSGNATYKIDDCEYYYSFHHILDQEPGWHEITMPLEAREDYWNGQGFNRTGWAGIPGNDLLDRDQIKGFAIEFAVDGNGSGDAATGTLVLDHLRLKGPLEFGVYSETREGCIMFGQPGACCRDGIYNSSGSYIVATTDTIEPPEGSACLKVEVHVLPEGWVGWFIRWGEEWEEDISLNMSAYTNGYMKFLVKTTTDLSIGIRSDNISPGDEGSKVWLSEYCPLDGQWHDVSIPIRDFLSGDARLDLTRMKILFNATCVEETGGTESLWIDNVRWTVHLPSNMYIFGLNPDRALNRGVVTDTAYGGGFQQSGMEVKLVKNQSVILGINTVPWTSNMITTDFDLTAADSGYWDVIVAGPGGQSDTLEHGFEIKITKPLSTGPVAVSGRKVLVGGEVYSIRGVGYAPTPIGKDPGWPLPDSGSSDTLIYHRDFQLLQEMGCNTIRTWGQVTAALLDIAGQYDLRVLCGFWVDTGLDLDDPLARYSVLTGFRVYVNTFKDAPAVLMWSIGNEQNYQNGNNVAWYSLVNEMAEAAYEEEGDTYHPVTSPNGEIDNIGNQSMATDDISMNYLDAWGANIYRGISFGSLFADYAGKSTKPFWISEYGIDAWDHQNMREYPETQALYVISLWGEMNDHSDICSGGTIMAYCDEWWKNGNPYAQETGGYPTPNHPDGWSDEEYYGIMWVEENGNSPDIMHPRAVYNSLQHCWQSSEAGDVNGDGDTNVLDVLAVVNHILGTRPLDTESCLRADCNMDGTINVLDALGIVNVILGIGTCGSSPG